MKNKIVLAMLSLVVLSMFAMPSHAVTFAQLQITSQTTPATITPGSDGYVQITIANSGTAASNDIQISSITVDNPVIVGSYTTDIGNVGSGKSISMLAKFSIPKDTKPGFYVMYIQVKECSESQCKDYSQSAIITVQTTPTLDISIAPTEFKSGEISNLTFEIKNKGGTITDFALTWSSDNILPLGNDNRLFVSSVVANSNILV